MSVLEFISSLKWPIVVLVIGLTAMGQLRRSPETRAKRSRGRYAQRRPMGLGDGAVGLSQSA
jgi:hypothetical protein